MYVIIAMDVQVMKTGLRCCAPMSDMNLIGLIPSPVFAYAIEYIRYSLCVFLRYVSWLARCEPRP